MVYSARVEFGKHRLRTRLAHASAKHEPEVKYLHRAVKGVNLDTWGHAYLGVEIEMEL